MKLLEFLSSDLAQVKLAEADHEWPVVKSVELVEEPLEEFGPFKADPLEVGLLARNAPAARRIFERAGWH